MGGFSFSFGAFVKFGGIWLILGRILSILWEVLINFGWVHFGGFLFSFGLCGFGAFLFSWGGIVNFGAVLFSLGGFC